MNSTFQVQSKQTKDPSLRRETCFKFGIMWQLVKAEFTITYYLSINVSSKKGKQQNVIIMRSYLHKRVAEA